LRNGSNISTTAGTARTGGDGGNITIDTTFLVAVATEDSNIRANAFTGRGGNIQITAQGIFGIEFRAAETVLSDITVSSQFGLSGTVVINTPDVDPTRGTVNLPNEFVSPSPLAGCQARGEGARFIQTGRGGLPASPYEQLDSLDRLDDLSLPAHWSIAPTGSQATSATLAPVIEARHWAISDRGEVLLVAQLPDCIRVLDFRLNPQSTIVP
jgi:large exoprotein involved in heme utilization and adhesion